MLRAAESDGALQEARDPELTPAQESERRSLRRTSQTFRAVAGRVRPAVVHIRSYLPRGASDLARDDAEVQEAALPTSLGSGVFIDPEGYILTSYHVVRNAMEIDVTLFDQRGFEAELVSFDPLSDLAVLHVQMEKAAPVAILGDSDSAEVGDWVLAIGSPLGLQQTVTAGIVSATGRDFFAGDREDELYFGYQNFIQTDAAIYQGSSGGPLLNLDGEVIGITHNKASSLHYDRASKRAVVRRYDALAFATPINLVKNVLQSMKEGRGAPRGRLGVGLHDVDQQLAEAVGLERIHGAQVQYVERKSPAARAGLRTGDIILRVGDRNVQNRTHLRGLVACEPVHSETTLTIFRNGGRRTLPFTVYPGRVFQRDSVLLGLALMDLTKVVADQLDLESPQGALVVSVKPDGPGKAVGIKPGMVIAAVNGTPTPDIRAYHRAAAKSLDAGAVQLVVNVRGKLHLLHLERNADGELTPVKPEEVRDSDEPGMPGDGAGFQAGGK
jgi:serine protease Do